MNFAIMIIAYLVDFVNRLWYNKEKWEGVNQWNRLLN